MIFEQQKIKLIEILTKSKKYNKNIALQRIVEIIEPIHSSKVLKKEKDLINRIAIDSVENWDTIELILNFPKKTVY
ncbi:hypothetical protein NACSLCCMFF_540017 [Tenacibaculum maritimum]|uniref:hypothetical protein n=1 Tax=Tenacibaculum maritimum TaxID=107401 RepID=UPI0012E6C94B|nr:hypothetical protein [Tenacibaculum maritimum]CAA0237807.1 hypothetical protein NACSLCCMFF_540017 [Tenacibaculum maritimum]